jgi:hypothetical protein
MKSLLLFITAFAFCLKGSGQEPASFNYQVVIHNIAGDALVTQAVSLKISIVAGSANNVVVYSEKHHVTTDTLGLVSLDIGNGTDKTGNFISIDWSAEKYFLKVEVDSSGGSNYADIVMTQILKVTSASSANKSNKISPYVIEDTLFISRKYVGKFEDYRQTGPDTYNGPNIIWIKTSMDEIFGKISAYGKKCKFLVGDKLYIKRTFLSPGGVSGYWVYRIESDSSVYYRVTDFQHDRKVFVETWFK